MKKVVLFVCCFVFTAANFYSQNDPIEPKLYKFAFINSYQFSDPKEGIAELRHAYLQLDQSICFTPPSTAEAVLKRAEKILVEPVNDKIKLSLTEIESRENLKLLNLPDYDNGSTLAINEKLDITKRFISDYNKKTDFQNEPFKYDIPKSKIAVIDSNKFFDNLNGIKRFTGLKDLESMCDLKTDLCKDLFSFLRLFIEEKNYGIILDSSKETPTELKNFYAADVTAEFISEYNDSNK